MSFSTMERPGRLRGRELLLAVAEGTASSVGDEFLRSLVRHVADAKGATPGQVALAWLLAQQPWIVPIPGTTKLHRLDENVGAATIDWTADALRAIGEALAQIEVQGDRYPAALAARVGK